MSKVILLLVPLFCNHSSHHCIVRSHFATPAGRSDTPVPSLIAKKPVENRLLAPSLFRISDFSLTRREQRQEKNAPHHYHCDCSRAYSASASFRMGRSGSASFHRLRKRL